MSLEKAAKDCASTEKNELLALREQANAGDALALAKLRALLQRSPSIVARYGNLATMAEQFVCANFAMPNDPTLPLIVAEKARTMREELLAGSTSPIIGLAVDRIVLSWLELYRQEVFHADPTKEQPAIANVLVKQRLATERRHQEALRTLALVRRLEGMLPPTSTKT